MMTNDGQDDGDEYSNRYAVETISKRQGLNEIDNEI